MQFKPSKILIFLLFLSSTAIPAFSQKPLEGRDLLNQANAKISNIGTDQLKRKLSENPDTYVIDVRTRDEILRMGGMIDGINSIHILRGWLELRIGEYVLNKDLPVVVYCGTNLRSPLAAQTLMSMGYSEVYNYQDGFLVWRDEGLPITQPTKFTDSILYDKPRKVIDGVWSAIGAIAPPSYENSGHNNNLSFIVTNDGVVVINAGAGYLLAQSLHDEIKKITSQAVRYVVLENGQGHAMLGSNYWKEQGAVIIAHEDTLHEIEKYGEDVLSRAKNYLLDKVHRTQLSLPDKTFSDRHLIELGGRKIELLNLGPAHSPGDIAVWLPEEKLVITGDLAFHQRLLPVFEHTNINAWIDTWDSLVELEPDYVIPGHGEPTNMSEVTKFTKDYLVYMRDEVEKLLDEGGELEDAANIDQSAYRHLKTYRELARLNASRIFQQMEFDF